MFINIFWFICTEEILVKCDPWIILYFNIFELIYHRLYLHWFKRITRKELKGREKMCAASLTYTECILTVWRNSGIPSVYVTRDTTEHSSSSSPRTQIFFIRFFWGFTYLSLVWVCFEIIKYKSDEYLTKFSDNN